jgi:hypothetical protein
VRPSQELYKLDPTEPTVSVEAGLLGHEAGVQFMRAMEAVIRDHLVPWFEAAKALGTDPRPQATLVAGILRDLAEQLEELLL